MKPNRSPAPTTRYQGSKLKLLPWIWQNIAHLPFHSVLDAFGGTGSVAYGLKQRGKAVTYNDYLAFNHQIGKALIENSAVTLGADALDFLLCRDPAYPYDDFIARTFADVYFTAEENTWLDVVAQNIMRLPGEYQRALAYSALFQACLIKRPYNLFHRKNVYLRTAAVPRSFGNKASWDRPFEDHFRRFADEINRSVFDSGVPCRALHGDALDAPGSYDLVYIDPPYVNNRGVGVDYLAFYHFLEGLTGYPGWSARIDHRRKHRPLAGPRSPWSDKKQVGAAFARLFERYAGSILVVSYRSDGIPAEDELAAMLRAVKAQVEVVRSGAYQYALSTNARSHEILLIGYD